MNVSPVQVLLHEESGKETVEMDHERGVVESHDAAMRLVR